MEPITKLIATVSLLMVLSGCVTTTTGIAPKVVEPPKPVVDARILQLCDTQLTPISDAPTPNDLFVSYGEALIRLNACACRQREARNALCTLSNPGCEVVKSCEQKGPINDSVN